MAVQAVLLWAFASAYIHGNIELASINLGLMLLGLGIAQHVYAVASQPA